MSARGPDARTRPPSLQVAPLTCACLRVCAAPPPQGRALLTLRRRCGQSTDGQTWPHALRLCEATKQPLPKFYALSTLQEAQLGRASSADGGDFASYLGDFRSSLARSPLGGRARRDLVQPDDRRQPSG